MRCLACTLLPAVVGVACLGTAPAPVAPAASPAAPAWTEVLAVPRPPRGELVVTGFTLDGDGVVDAADVRAALLAGGGRAQPCYQRALAAGSAVPRSVRVDLTIDARGQVTGDASGAVEGAGVVECLVESLRQQRYPAPEVATAHVHVRVDFVRLL